MKGSVLTTTANSVLNAALMWALPASMALAQPVVPDAGDSGRNECTDAGAVTADEARTAAGEPKDTSEWQIRDAEAAVERARAIIGLKELEDSQVHAELTVLREDNTPYLSEQIVGRPLWRVTVKQWSVKVPSLPEGVTDRFVRTLDVYLDPIDGKLLKIESRWPEDEPRLVEPLDADSATKDLVRTGERFHRFPDTPPSISFVEALEVLESQGAHPTEAKQIAAWWVIWSSGSREPKAMWAITLRSVAPSPLTWTDADAAARSQWRNIVDPVSKRWITGGNVRAGNTSLEPPRPSNEDG